MADNVEITTLSRRISGMRGYDDHCSCNDVVDTCTRTDISREMEPGTGAGATTADDA